MDFDAYARSLGLDPTTLTAEQHSRVEAAWRASLKPTPAPTPAPTPTPVPNPAPVNRRPDDEFNRVIQETEAENERRNAVTMLVARFIKESPDRVKQLEPIGRLALSGGWTIQQTELELLKVSYANGPLAFSPSKPATSETVLEAAVCRSAGMQREVIEKNFDDKTLSAVDKHFRGEGCGLKRLIVTCAQANGYRDADISGLRQTLKAAFREPGDDRYDGMASSGFGPSTYSLSGILSNVANKFIVDAFNYVEMVWRKITATRPVNDFKEISSFALTGDLTYKEVAPGGEVKHGTLGEESYGNRAKLFALMLGIDYQHIRNDDLGAFAKLSRMMGRGGALTINKVFWTEFLNLSANFWSAANGNYGNSTDYAFTLDGLGNAAAAWDLRTDPQGQPMGDQARYLLVPTALDLAARKAMRSTTVMEDGGEGSDNPLAGKWEPLASTYLGNSTYTGYSASQYYLIADPQDLPVIETAFLDGQEMPTIEMAEPDLSQLGIMVRGVHAFGCRRQEPRGGYKFKQTA